MNIPYIDHHLPKRWNLLLHYWVPFLQTPSDFYFQSRSFVDQLIKHLLAEDFPLEKFPDLVLILVKYANTQNEKLVAKKIIAEIFTHKTKRISLRFLSAILKNFSPNDKNIEILDEIFRRIPDKIYFDYFNPILENKNCSSLNLQWCAYFRNKFSLKARLTLCLSLPDDKLIANKTTLSTLLLEECEEKFTENFDLSLLNDHTTNRLLSMTFANPSACIFSKNVLRAFVNQLLKKARESKKNQDSVIDSYIRSLDTVSAYKFFKDFLAEVQNYENIEYFFDCCAAEQRSKLIDHVIISAFNAKNLETNNQGLRRESTIPTDSNLLLLTLLQKKIIKLPVNDFQFLAIQYLTQRSFDLNLLKKRFSKTQSLEDHRTFSPALQLAIAESYITAIKKFIKYNYMIHVPKENKRQNIHHIFNQFCNGENDYKLQNIIALIVEKLPEALRSNFEADLNFLQLLLSQLELILADSAVANYKNELMIKQIKNQIDYEEKTQASQELMLRLYQGEQTLVSSQYMVELFGDKASALQEKLSHKLGINFFNAEDPEELAIATKEAETIKAFKRKYHDLYSVSAISCNLSSSPCLSNYFSY